MRNYFFLLCCILVFNTATGQFIKNNILVAGTVSYGSVNDKYGSNQEIDTKTTILDPEILYQINNNLAAGITCSIENLRSKENGLESKLSAFGIGPVLRYQMKWVEKASAFLELSAMQAKIKSETPFYLYNGNFLELISKKSTYKLFIFEVAPGFNYGISNRFYLDIRYGSIQFSNVSDDNNKSSSFDVSLDLSSLKLGGIYRFGKGGGK